MQLPIVAQSPIFAQPWEAGAGTPDVVRIAEACDRAGFFYLAVSDHICIPRERALAMSIVWFDPVATLGFLAAATRQVRLLSYVYVLPYRHPLATAKAFATLDALSGGRVILGVGAGHLEPEFRTLGVDFARRGRLLDEAIDVIVKAFLDEFPDHAGPTWTIHGVGVGPRPRQRPRPPIWVGGSTRAALRRAAERGDGWLPQGVPPMGLAEAITYVRRVRGIGPGLGRAVALALAREGADVVLAARTAPALEHVAAEVRAAGRRALDVPTDVTQPEQCRQLAEAAHATFGRIDVLVNNAFRSGPYDHVEHASL